MWLCLYLVLISPMGVSSASIPKHPERISTPLIEKRIPQNCTAVSPAPADLVCGEAGYLSKAGYAASFAAPQVVEDFESCRDLCLSRAPPDNSKPRNETTFCNSFSYNPTSGECDISPTTLRGKTGSGFRPNATSPTVHWNAFCFECATRCPQAAGVNLLDNAGFEVSSRLLGPWAGYGGKQTDPYYGYVSNHGHDSAHGWACAGGSCNLEQYFNACPGQLYTFSYDCHIGLASKSGLDYLGMVYIGELNTEPAAIPPGNTSWTTLEYTFRASHDVERCLAELFEGRGYREYYDNFVVAPAPAPLMPLPQGTNLIANGDFETGALHPWTFTAFGATGGAHAIVSPGLGPSSQYAFKYTANATSGVPQFALNQHNAGARIAAFGRYLVTFEYKVEGAQGAPGVSAVGSLWYLNGQAGLDVEPIDDNGVRTFQRVATNADAGGEVYVSLMFGGLPDAGEDDLTVYVDNVSLLPLD